MHGLYNFIFSHHKEPRHVPQRVGRVSSPRLVRRPSTNVFELDMKTTPFCLTESIASKALADSQAKMAVRGRSGWAARQRPESKPPPPTGVAQCRDRKLDPQTRPSQSLDRLSRTDRKAGEPRPPDSHLRVRATLHQYSSDLRARAPNPIAQHRTMLHGRGRFWHHDMGGGSLKTTSQRKSLPMISSRPVANNRRRL